MYIYIFKYKYLCKLYITYLVINVCLRVPVDDMLIAIKSE